MADEQKPTPIPLVPGQFPTGRASHSLFLHAGGSFVLALLDERLVNAQNNTLSTANFEVGRYGLGPIAALWLANNVLAALRDYQEKFGPLPKNVLPPGLPQIGDAIAALEEMLKQSRQEPPAPPETSGGKDA